MTEALSTELVINSAQNESRIALLKERNLSEYHTDGGGTEFKVGDIYVGTVKKVVPGLNAASIDIGYEKDAFLHYLDLGQAVQSMAMKFSKMVQSSKYNNHKLNGFKLEPEINKLGKISQVFSKNQQILVQVVKEPISTKEA